MRYDPYACLGKRPWGPYGLDVSDYPDRIKLDSEDFTTRRLGDAASSGRRSGLLRTEPRKRVSALREPAAIAERHAPHQR